MAGELSSLVHLSYSFELPVCDSRNGEWMDLQSFKSNSLKSVTIMHFSFNI